MPQKKYYEKEKNCTTREKHFRNKYVEKKEEEAPEKNETETQRDERDNR